MAKYRNIPAHERAGDIAYLRDLNNRARICGIPDSYYTDHIVPPPFRTMLAGCVGYIATSGQVVRYGRRPVPETTRQFLDRVEPEIEQSIFGGRLVEATTYPAPRPRRIFRCVACGSTGTSDQVNRHHPMPVSIMPSRKTVRLCLRCHKLVHTLATNEVLASLTLEAQLDLIRNAPNHPT